VDINFHQSPALFCQLSGVSLANPTDAGVEKRRRSCGNENCKLSRELVSPAHAPINFPHSPDNTFLKVPQLAGRPRIS